MRPTSILHVNMPMFLEGLDWTVHLCEAILVVYGVWGGVIELLAATEERALHQVVGVVHHHLLRAHYSHGRQIPGRGLPEHQVRAGALPAPQPSNEHKLSDDDGTRDRQRTSTRGRDAHPGRSAQRG
jgi:hypothetical protein